jgi:hypothetical protein
MVLASPERNMAERRTDNLDLHSIRRKPVPAIQGTLNPGRPHVTNGAPSAKAKHPAAT